MNANDPFDAEAVKRMAQDRAMSSAANDFFLKSCEHRYSYNFSWMGRPIIQYPQDIIALQEIIWSVRPELIVETGIAHGGSTVFFASLLELLGGDGRVVAIDVDIRPHNRAAIDAHPMRHRIDMIEGSSIDPIIAAETSRRAVGRAPVLVVLDSNHTHDHVLRELELYAPLVTRGSYLVVMDTVVEHMPEGAFPDRPWGKGNNPMTAVQRYLSQSDRFAVDKQIEDKLLVTVAPSGYLRCVKD
jgi:cephalosporin hydroxylase